MPQVGAFLLGAANAFGAGTWVASAASVGAFSAGFTVGNVLATSFVGRLLTSVALSALSMAMAPRPRAPGIRTSQTQTGGTNPCQFILGRYATGGYAASPAMSHGKAGKTPNAYLNYVIEVSDAPVTAINGLILDGTQVSIGTAMHPDYGNEIGGDFQDRAWIRFHDGSQTAADPMLLAKYADYPDRPWQADMIGRGLAYAVLTFRYDREVFDSLPSVRFVVDGIRLYDPRKDSSVGGSGSQRWADPASWTFSRNPIVMIYTILRGLTLPDGSRWGGDCTADDRPLANWIAAMNLCDVEVTLAGGDTVPRYTAGFEVSVDDEPAAVIEELLKACHGQLADMGGIWKIRAGGPGLPVLFFSDEDVIATRPEEFDPFPGLAETFNGISATYPEPASLWESREAPARYNAEWEAEDGGRRLVAALSLPAVTHSRQVQHLMQAAIRDHRRMRRHNLTLTPAAAILEPLDVVSWTSARNGYAAKAFEVAQVVEDLRSCLPQLALREVDPTDYDWSPGDELPSDPGPGGVIRPLAQAVPGFGVSGVSITDATGADRRPALQLIWDGAELDDVEALEWEVRRSGSTTLVAQGSTSNVEAGLLRVTGGILPGTIYEARARLVVRRKRAWTSWISATTPDTRVGPADIAEAVYADMEATARLAGVTPVSELPPTGQLNQIVMLIPPGRLYRWDGTAWVTDLYAGIEPGSLDVASFASSIRPIEVVSILPTDGNTIGRMVFLTTDNKLYRWTGSAWTSAVPAADVTGQLVASQIADAAITTAKFAAGIEPVEIVATLPSSDNFPGRIVFLTSDTKLYRHTGSAWTSAVPAADVTGQLVASQIADAAITTAKFAAGIEPVEIVATLPTTGNFAGRMAFLTSDSKLYRHTGTAWTSAVPAADVTGQLVGSQIADAAITTAKFAAGIEPVEIVASLPTTGNFAGRIVFLTSDSKLYRHTGTAWVSTVPAADVTGQLSDAQIAAVAAGKLTGQITSTQISDDAITTPKLAAGAVTANEIAADAVTTAKIAAGAVTASEIAANTITAAQIATGAITADELAANAVVAGKIAAGAISATEIAADAVTTAKIAAGAVTASEIAANTITAAQIATGAITADELAANAVVAGKIAAGAISATEIAADAVTTAKIAAGAVTASEIAANTITASQIAAGAITSSELAANAVIAGKIAAGAISATEIASDAITTAKIAAGAVTASEIAANTITAAQIATGAITADELAANAVIAGKVAAGAIAADQIAAGAVIASKLAVADFTNQVPDSEMQDIASWVRSSSTAIVYYPASPRSDARSIGAYMYDHSANTAAADHSIYSKTFFPCTPGDEIFASGQVIRSGGTKIVALLQLLFYDKNDVILATGGYQTVASINTTANTATPYSGSVTVPAGAFQARFRYYVYAAAGETDGDLYLMAPVARFRAKGELIVDGAITASKISAGAVTADAIAANAIVASKIAAGEITGTKLAATGIITATAQINNAVITGAKIASATIGTANIANAAITGAKIGNLEVDTINLAGNAVTVPQFASATAGSVTMTLVLDQTAPVLLWGHVTNVIVNDTSRQAQLKVNGTIVRRAYYAMDINVSVFGPGTGYSTSVFVSGASNLSLLHRTSLAAGTHTIVVDAGTGDNASTQCSVLALQVKK